MRVVLVGSPSRRQKLRAHVPADVAVVAEAPTIAAARALPIDVDGYLVAPASPAEEQPLVEALTARETQVLTLVADGLSNKAVAARLGLSDETVKFHLASIFGKLGASNRTDAVRQGLQRGIVAL
jgi:DNA-binding NarL/FixJ family response regulator